MARTHKPSASDLAEVAGGKGSARDRAEAGAANRSKLGHTGRAVKSKTKGRGRKHRRVARPA